MKSLTDVVGRPPPTNDLIDVRKLIAQMSDEQLLAAADAYFSKLTVESEQCRKPFSNAADAVHITGHLSLLLQAADLFSGADVLDFGCATGWLTMALADMGSNAVGVDISPSAVALAQALKSTRVLVPGGLASFLTYDGQRLPLPDESIDRVVCFDAFHHVKDQAHVLREFARVLRHGGRVAMVEPGPNHSRAVQSQMEMARYSVIENDVVMGDIARAAAAAGLSAPQMLVQFQRPIKVPVSLFEQWSAGDLPRHEAQTLLSTLTNQLSDTQCFFICKGDAVPDSRRTEALAAEVRLLSAQATDSAFLLRFRIRNTGEAEWMSPPGQAGQVNLGCQLIGPGGHLQQLDYRRFSLDRDRVFPGAEFELVVRLDMPFPEGCSFRFDLVSEQIAWFEQTSRCRPAEWQPPV